MIALRQCCWPGSAATASCCLPWRECCVGGAISPAVADALYDAYGWTGGCWFGAALPLVGLAIWTARLRRSRRQLTEVAA
jgi:predicted MFS family arabinose efflux permease